jgi:hypothetical protein
MADPEMPIDDDQLDVWDCIAAAEAEAEAVDHGEPAMPTLFDTPAGG